MQNVDGDDVFVDLVCLAIPVVQDVKSILPCPRVARPHDSGEVDPAARVLSVCARNVSQTKQRLPEIGRLRESGSDVPPCRTAKSSLQNRARAVKGDLNDATLQELAAGRSPAAGVECSGHAHPRRPERGSGVLARVAAAVGCC